MGPALLASGTSQRGAFPISSKYVPGNYLESHALDEYTRAMLPFLLTDEIERATENLIVPEFLSVRLCMILGFSKNPWRPAIQIP